MNENNCGSEIPRKSQTRHLLSHDLQTMYFCCSDSPVVITLLPSRVMLQERKDVCCSLCYLSSAHCESVQNETKKNTRTETLGKNKYHFSYDFLHCLILFTNCITGSVKNMTMLSIYRSLYTMIYVMLNVYS